MFARPLGRTEQEGLPEHVGKTEILISRGGHIERPNLVAVKFDR
jgi:hypothetical protein